MKSKSFDSASSSTVKNELDHNNSFDFIRFYKTAEETKASLQKYRINVDKDKSDDVNTSTPKRERSPHKRKKNKTAVELSLINIESPAGTEASGGAGAGCNTPLNETKVTSTPLGHKETVKSIMKTGTTATVRDDAMDGSLQEVVSTSKPKKRNKSVSFMLEDNDELAIKKTKSDNNKQQPTSTHNKIKSNKKKMSKNGQAEKENKANGDNKVTNEHVKDKKDKMHKARSNKKSLAEHPTEGPSDTSSTQTETAPQELIKKKQNKVKKLKKPDGSESEPKTQTNQNTEKKKAKKKKHEPKSQTDTEEEPASKSRKKEIKPELIAEDLSNLSIGDNPHTLSSLLDEMTVTDKEKRKKLRKKASKSKKAKSKEEVPEPQNTEEMPKEKKWKRKRWNKDKKAKETIEGLTAAVIVENLPISMLFSYKKILAEHFAKYGLLRNVGIAEVYPTEVSQPVFTTTVYFDTEDSATKALAEDGSTLEGSRIAVRRPLPATLTTAVVRSYGALSEQALTTAFSGAAVGRIRSIRIAVKGKKTMSTAFLEFDGPEAVERAIKMESEIKIGGKKIHVSKFELRSKKKEEKSGDNMASASDADHSDDNDTQN